MIPKPEDFILQLKPTRKRVKALIWHARKRHGWKYEKAKKAFDTFGIMEWLESNAWVTANFFVFYGGCTIVGEPNKDGSIYAFPKSFWGNQKWKSSYNEKVNLNKYPSPDCQRHYV